MSIHSASLVVGARMTSMAVPALGGVILYAILPRPQASALSSSALPAPFLPLVAVPVSINL
jgi:hypothetical protein